jgi:hypothetical protein
MELDLDRRVKLGYRLALRTELDLGNDIELLEDYLELVKQQILMEVDLGHFLLLEEVVEDVKQEMHIGTVFQALGAAVVALEVKEVEVSGQVGPLGLGAALVDWLN